MRCGCGEYRDLCGRRKATLFRPGHITLEDLERALGEEVEVSKAILEKLPEVLLSAAPA